MHILLINPVLGHCCSCCFQQAKPPAKVTDLTKDLRDGQILLTLMEVLFGVKVTRAEPTSKRINQIKNVEEAMSILLQNNICKPVSDIVTTKGYRKATTLVRGEMLLQFVASILESLVIHAIWLAFSSVIYSRIILSFALNHVFFKTARFMFKIASLSF